MEINGAGRTVRSARYRAVLAYDGTNYYGFQRLPSNQPTIQSAVETVLTRLSNQPVTIIGAGRTDTGVHAAGQVIAFDLVWKHRIDDLLRAINATLPIDIAVQRLEQAALDFHPRFNAHSRTYCYTVYVAPVRQPLLARTAWHIWPPKIGRLDVGQMNRAAAQLVGIHDYASFGSPPQSDGGSLTTIRQIFRSLWSIGTDERLLYYVVEANAFLYHMVRSIVGALVEIGLNRMALDEFSAAFQAKDRIGKLAPPHGLSLIEVTYNGSGTTPAGDRSK